MKNAKFKVPPREPLTKSEMLEEIRLQSAFAEAGRASMPESEKPLRAVKVTGMFIRRVLLK